MDNNYGLRIPPVDIVNVVVPDVPTAVGVAVYKYPVEDIAQVKLYPDLVTPQ